MRGRDRRVAPLRIGLGIGPQHLGLDGDELLKVRLVPVAADGVLIGPAPDGIEELPLVGEGGADPLLGLLVAAQSEKHGVFDGVGIEIFVAEAPSGSICVVLSIEVLMQRSQQGCRNRGVGCELNGSFGNHGGSGRRSSPIIRRKKMDGPSSAPEMPAVTVPTPFTAPMPLAAASGAPQPASSMVENVARFFGRKG